MGKTNKYESEENMTTTIQKRQTKKKELILEQLKKTPIVQIACDRAGVSRASYYRWINSDIEFAKASEQALQDGNLLINDMAESQLLSAIKDKNMTAIIYWLKHRHPAYLTRVEISSGNKPKEELNPEQEEAVKRALLMAGIVPKENNKQSDE